ncbi:Protein-tyrosine sulfotransferase [Acorus calamus]|uniref:Sulfotransferase n=1 Tax=Acorus calamus TaxID=4465 RepID=A0AAV9C455_ACOCL|nr:Protein-tyrosine sulfotransferase [Acorus calamus]
MLLVIVSTSKLVSCAANDFEHCESTVLKWAASSSDNGSKEDRLTLKDLLFFLHVPRTGGRTYFYCFLKKLYPTSQECPRSYDKLRFDPSKPNCRLVVTHDDYSLMSKLPKERTSVVTILRNPVDRVFSTYEFSVEVAARFLVHPNLTSVSKMSLRLRSSKKRGVSTLDIWPWKYLVPWMVEDLFGRRATRKYRLDLLDIDKDGDTYNMEDFVMPLNDYINNPMAHDLIHNGATFQVAGLTNNSCLAESNEIRLCVREHPSLGRHVLDVAKKRLDDMLYVGLTEDHKQSATMFANMVGAQVLSQLETLSLRTDDESTNSTGSKPYSSINLQNRTDNQKATEVSAPENVEQANGNMTVAKLMEAYEVCVSNTRKSQATRRINSLKQISPVNFSKEARLQVPETLLQQIQSLNSLDWSSISMLKIFFDSRASLSIRSLLKWNHRRT